THTEANTFKCIAGRVMKCLANNMFKTIAKEKENGEVPEEIHQEISDHKEIENHKEAKATMKSYLEEKFHLGSLSRSFSTQYDNDIYTKQNITLRLTYTHFFKKIRQLSQHFAKKSYIQYSDTLLKAAKTSVIHDFVAKNEQIF